jgi:outer membrane receptor protein involved in Fe transport
VQGQENLTFRLTALASDNDFEDEYSGFQRKFIAPSLAWKINENTNLTFQVHYLDDWHYALNVRNVFDKNYESGYSYAGEKRTVLLTASQRW